MPRHSACAEAKKNRDRRQRQNQGHRNELRNLRRSVIRRQNQNRTRTRNGVCRCHNSRTYHHDQRPNLAASILATATAYRLMRPDATLANILSHIKRLYNVPQRMVCDLVLRGLLCCEDSGFVARCGRRYQMALIPGRRRSSLNDPTTQRSNKSKSRSCRYTEQDRENGNDIPEADGRIAGYFPESNPELNPRRWGDVGGTGTTEEREDTVMEDEVETTTDDDTESTCSEEIEEEIEEEVEEESETEPMLDDDSDDDSDSDDPNAFEDIDLGSDSDSSSEDGEEGDGTVDETREHMETNNPQPMSNNVNGASSLAGPNLTVSTNVVLVDTEGTLSSAPAEDVARIAFRALASLYPPRDLLSSQNSSLRR